MSFKLRKIISGGQTGADQAGLRAARAVGLETGGMMPRGCLTEYGPNRALLEEVNMTESEYADYPPRTRWNVMNSDATVLFGNYTSRGTDLTIRFCDQFDKVTFKVPFPVTYKFGFDARKFMVNTMRVWLQTYNVKVLNVAGNRESKNPGIGHFTEEFLVEVIRDIQGELQYAKEVVEDATAKD